MFGCVLMHSVWYFITKEKEALLGITVAGLGVVYFLFVDKGNGGGNVDG